MWLVELPGGKTADEYEKLNAKGSRHCITWHSIAIYICPHWAISDAYCKAEEAKMLLIGPHELEATRVTNSAHSQLD